MIVCGIDEAGRGPIIGPMVIAGVSFKEEVLLKLAKIGVRDSKTLSPTKREELYYRIKDLAENYHIVKISPAEIDNAIFSGLKLTKLEAKYIAEIMKKVEAEIYYIDSPQNNPNSFLKVLNKFTDIKNVVCEIKADKKYVQVSAASILAKVERDKEIRKMYEKYGNFGSGYTSDKRTINFLKEKISKGEIPEEVRKSWKTYRKLIEENSLFKFSADY
ncbi:MAG: ribonuclease HII [Thermoproteota archaeon]|nr:ribonuclease HII [Thermoproteota archaeon]